MSRNRDLSKKLRNLDALLGDKVLTKEDLGLGNVANVSDSALPVSSAMQTALNGKLSKSGGTMTGHIIDSSGTPAMDGQVISKGYLEERLSSGTGYTEYFNVPVVPTGAPVKDGVFFKFRLPYHFNLKEIRVDPQIRGGIEVELLKNGVTYDSVHPSGLLEGESWVSNSPPVKNWTSVCWSPELGIFVAVAFDGPPTQVMTSPDGVTWTARTVPEPANWNAVCWSPELGIFVAVSQSGTNRVMTSPDGITWTPRSTPEANAWRSVCWSPELNLFVAVADSGTNRIMTSPNGITWTARFNSEVHSFRAVCWSPELGLFVAVSSGSVYRIVTSPNGTTWTARDVPITDYSSVCWSPELRLFVAVATGGTNRVMTSPDGITWTARTAAEANAWYSVCWSAELGIFVAVAYSGTNRVMTSPDGITWTARTAAQNNNWYSVCWSPQLSLFVAVAYSGTDRVMTLGSIDYNKDQIKAVNYSFPKGTELTIKAKVPLPSTIAAGLNVTLAGEQLDTEPAVSPSMQYLGFPFIKFDSTIMPTVTSAVKTAVVTNGPIKLRFEADAATYTDRRKFMVLINSIPYEFLPISYILGSLFLPMTLDINNGDTIQFSCGSTVPDNFRVTFKASAKSGDFVLYSRMQSQV